MCGDWPPRISVGGALAVMSPSLPINKSLITGSSWQLFGRLLFKDVGGGSSMATHAIYVPDSPLWVEMIRVHLDNCVVKIHEAGDLTKPAAESPLWATLSLKPVEHVGIESVMYELERPVKTEVGDDGIIGRRVSIWLRESTESLSEGIVGFN
ncbi:hypothetical protein F5B21DRAFT_351597 [Xylaria acuta]|nr:hypothetical protein F5B21DRAFT_351597 [Xylaria acuta]